MTSYALSGLQARLYHLWEGDIVVEPAPLVVAIDNHGLLSLSAEVYVGVVPHLRAAWGVHLGNGEMLWSRDVTFVKIAKNEETAAVYARHGGQAIKASELPQVAEFRVVASLDAWYRWFQEPKEFPGCPSELLREHHLLEPTSKVTSAEACDDSLNELAFVFLIRSSTADRIRDVQLDVLAAVVDGEDQICVADGDHGEPLLRIPAAHIEIFIESLRRAMRVLADKPPRSEWYGRYARRE